MTDSTDSHVEKMEKLLDEKVREYTFNDADMQLFWLKLYVFAIHYLRMKDDVDMDRVYGKTVCPITIKAAQFLLKDLIPYVMSLDVVREDKSKIIARVADICAISITQQYLMPPLKHVLPSAHA